jgi:hypothetical protein
MERRGKSLPCARAKDFLKLAANAGHERGRIAFDLNTKSLFDHKQRPFIEPVAPIHPSLTLQLLGWLQGMLVTIFPAQFQRTTTEMARMSFKSRSTC